MDSAVFQLASTPVAGRLRPTGTNPVRSGRSSTWLCIIRDPARLHARQIHTVRVSCERGEPDVAPASAEVNAGDVADAMCRIAEAITQSVVKTNDTTGHCGVPFSSGVG